MEVALRLALGRAVPRAGDVDWTATLTDAMRERLGGLGWLRSGDVIRAHASRDVVDRWRTLAVVTDQRGRQRLDTLLRVLDALAAAGLEPIVLKGMPLSQRLYGDPFVRTSDDIDLFVHAGQRRAATDVLRSLGWVRVDGAPPWDELFVTRAPEQVYLELHESLVTDYLAHLRVPPPQPVGVRISGRDVPGLGGALLPALLAAHLAGHQLPPLLWGVDFLTLWGSLAAGEQRDATEAADRAGLRRYLEWGIAFAAAVEATATHDDEAAARLGLRGTDRTDAHLSILRHARLADSPADAVRAVGACVWPRPLRWDVAALGRRLLWGIGYRGRRRDRAAALRARQLAGAAGSAPPARVPNGTGVA